MASVSPISLLTILYLLPFLKPLLDNSAKEHESFLKSLKIPFNTQKSESKITIFPVPHNNLVSLSNNLTVEQYLIPLGSSNSFS